MNIEKTLANAFRMDEEVWQRHANPWSVWTRAATLPVLLLAVASHVWLGASGGLAATGVVLVWLWVNPRLFPPPVHTDQWASKGTFGERIWIERGQVVLPPRHRLVPKVLAVVAGVGFVVGVGGALAGQGGPAIAGGLVAVLAKLWFVDRMVWLYEDMKDTNPVYRAWLR